MDSDLLNTFQDNDEWDQCFEAVEDWDAIQDLIASSNAVDVEEEPRPEYLEVLQRCFGHQRFRPMQWKIINSIINNRRDNCAVMATGYGKSLCFQYPSVYLGGVTIVVSPLISLMEDQVLSLTMSNIPACLLGSAQTNKKEVMNDIFENKYNLVYVTPELCCGDYGLDLLSRMNQNLDIILLAIDEAHCVSSWGHDFRYHYRELGKLRNILPNVPILAVTATATVKVRNDIVSCLNLRNPQVLCSGFDRPNLQFFVYTKGGDVFDDLRKIMPEKNKTWGFPGSTIIYCITRKQTEETAELFKYKGIKCLPYHAGMSLKARKDAHELFVRDKMKIIVATIAFGMGIDKPDVRNIIHYGASKDLESYYQEVGRAGRDGQPSNCFTFYKNSDFMLHKAIREKSGTTAKNRERQDAMERIMRQYLETRNCRRQFILNHFQGSTISNKPKPNCCDNCTKSLTNTTPDNEKYEGLDKDGLYDFTRDGETFLSVVDAMGGRFGIGMYVLMLRGSRSTKLFKNFHQHPLHGSGKHQSEEWWKNIGSLLERESYLTKQNKPGGFKKGLLFCTTLTISPKGRAFLVQAKMDPQKKILLLPPTAEMFKFLKSKYKEVPEEALFSSSSGLSQPSTSRPTRADKALLKLLPVESSKKAAKSSLKDILNDDSPSPPPKPPETDWMKEERMKVYRLLMNKRSEIASKFDCMPYMVASNEALMKMAQHKPCSLDALRKCNLDGFTEVKLKKFGDEFVRTLQSICGIDPEMTVATAKSIQDILAEHPLPGTKLGATAEASYSIYKSGLTIQEIATKRGVVAAVILSHLIDAMKAGYPIKMIDLNVTDEARDQIITAIKNPPINFDMSRTTPIKEACPEATPDEIKVVVAYLQIRQHLASLNVPYEEFEPPPEVPLPWSEPSRPKTDGASLKPQKVNLSALSVKKQDKRDSDTDDSLVFTKRPKKKPRRVLESPSVSDDFGFLDSPPASSTNVDKVDSPPRKINNGDPGEDFSFLDSPPSKKKDLCDESLLEDDFFDDFALDSVDKVVAQSQPSPPVAERKTDDEKKKFTFKSKNIFAKANDDIIELDDSAEDTSKKQFTVKPTSDASSNSKDNLIVIEDSPNTKHYRLSQKDIANFMSRNAQASPGAENLGIVNTSQGENATSTQEEKRKKKFTFKSKVPASVEKCTRQLVADHTS